MSEFKHGKDVAKENLKVVEEKKALEHFNQEMEDLQEQVNQCLKEVLVLVGELTSKDPHVVNTCRAIMEYLYVARYEILKADLELENLNSMYFDDEE
jgi:hypothetical protein